MTMSSRYISLRIRDFAKSQSGATAIEYGLIAASVGIVTALAFAQIGSILQTNYYNILASLF